METPQAQSMVSIGQAIRWGISFGISSITAPFAVLEEWFIYLYSDMLSMSGRPQSVNRDIRQMDQC